MTSGFRARFLGPSRASTCAEPLRSGPLERNVGDNIRLTMPATAASVRIARAGAVALATRAGFTYRQGEELRLAVGEAAALLAPGDDGRGALEVVYTVEDESLRVDLSLTDEGTAVTEVPDIAVAVLDASVDSWRVGDGGHRIVLRKHVPPEEADDD